MENFTDIDVQILSRIALQLRTCIPECLTEDNPYKVITEETIQRLVFMWEPHRTDIAVINWNKCIIVPRSNFIDKEVNSKLTSILFYGPEIFKRLVEIANNKKSPVMYRLNRFIYGYSDEEQQIMYSVGALFRTWLTLAHNIEMCWDGFPQHPVDSECLNRLQLDQPEHFKFINLLVQMYRK